MPRDVRTDDGDASSPSVERTVERAVRRSQGFDRLVRCGLVGYGVLHLLVAWTAIRLVVGAGGSASTQGALARLGTEPWGVALLIALACGFVVLAVWQAVTALVGYRDREGWRRPVMRAGAGCRVLTYGYLAVSITRLLVEGRHSTGSARATSAGVLAEPLGRALLGVAGLVIAGVGVGLIAFGVRRGFLDQLDVKVRHGEGRVPVVVLGQVGYSAKGVAFVIIGAVVCWAAVTDDPSHAGGLDRSLAHVVRLPLGGAAVLAIGVGIAAFAGYLFARARHLAPRTLTS